MSLDAITQQEILGVERSNTIDVYTSNVNPKYMQFGPPPIGGPGNMMPNQGGFGMNMSNGPGYQSMNNGPNNNMNVGWSPAPMSYEAPKNIGNIMDNSFGTVNNTFGNINPAPFSGGVDLPNSGLQLHNHGFDNNHMATSHFKTHTGIKLDPVLNSYETAMADHYADNLGFKKIQVEPFIKPLNNIKPLGWLD